MKNRLSIICGLCVFFINEACIVAFGGIQTNEITLTAAELDQNARLVNLLFDRQNGVITLDDMLLTEDDAPATGIPEGYEDRQNEWMEGLKTRVVIKKTLVLDKPRARAGRLVFLAKEAKDNTNPLYISINDVEITRRASPAPYPFARQFTELEACRWFYVDIPVAALKKGANDILMWSDANSPTWQIYIACEPEFARGSSDRRRHPNRSAKSFDGGKTWSYTRLGNADSVDGEYSIRISQDRYVPGGEYISPIIDVVNNRSVFKRNVALKKAQIKFDIETPGRTSARILARFGSSPLSSDPSWSNWHPIGRTHTTNSRYLRYRIELATDEPLKTPVIKGLNISAEIEDGCPNSNIAVKVVSNGIIAESSYPFGYENLLHPGLEKFRKNHKLDKIVKNTDSEFEIMIRLLNWSYRIPVSREAYSWDWNRVTVIKEDEDGMPRLLGPYGGRRRDAMCLYSNQALIAALLSMGYQARHINIHSEGASGHEVMEVWSNEFNKWIYMDATRDYYYFDPMTGTPLNVLELHNLLVEQMPRKESWQRPFIYEMGKEIAARIDVGIRQGDNPFSIEKDGRHILEIMGHFRIIPRNDFLSNPLPVPVHTGATMWGWDGFVNWFDETFPKRYEYQRYTDRAVDFYQPLNQSRVFLMETDNPGVLRIEVDTFTPGGLDSFLVKLDDGKETKQKDSSWLWWLREGLNTIEVKARNVRKVTGPTSKLSVTYIP